MYIVDLICRDLRGCVWKVNTRRPPNAHTCI